MTRLGGEDEELGESDRELSERVMQRLAETLRHGSAQEGKYGSTFDFELERDYADSLYFEALVISEEQGTKLIIVRDATERIVNERRIYQAAYHDIFLLYAQYAVFKEETSKTITYAIVMVFIIV